VAKSFARIHRSNLINSGIIPLVFQDESDYDTFSLNQELVIDDALIQIKNKTLLIRDPLTGRVYKTIADFSPKEIEMLKAGGKINRMIEENKK
jgi:aconitate hydratase